MAEDMQFCIECGENLPDSAAFCPNCGLNVDEARASTGGASGGGGATTGGGSHSGTPSRGSGGAGRDAQRSEEAYSEDVRESLVEQGEQISFVALLFMGLAGGLFVVAAFVPTWYMKCAEMGRYGYDCASYAPMDVPAQWRGWVVFWGGLVLLSLADEYANLGVFGSWRIKKSKLLLIAGIFGMAPHGALQPANGNLQLGGAVILTAGTLMLLYAIPTMVWQWLFDKRIGRR
ncbi:zinc ribbon domain-containing protein [Halostella litorea]|uniref:zinc ribbon domain-containing protein n=1 Tax=Halostella litorea TaxID=2528831 RepID=UPI0010930968|nr:zinc ribbon domain-containing protein [Halostella litorea]